MAAICMFLITVHFKLNKIKIEDLKPYLLVLSFLLGPLSTFSGLMEKPMRHIRPSYTRYYTDIGECNITVPCKYMTELHVIQSNLL